MRTAKKIVTFVPASHADIVRKAIGEAGAGRLGQYAFCSFSTRGTGRFLPLEGANPAIGEVGQPEAVEEERIEFICEPEALEAVVAALRAAHPYEEIPIEAHDIRLL